VSHVNFFFFFVRTNQKNVLCRNIFSKFIPSKLKKSTTLKRNYPTNHSLAHITFFMKKFFHNKHYKEEQIRNNQNPNRNFVKSKYNPCIPVE
jgi:RimJ/RimL family protein N-acetyltransferase